MICADDVGLHRSIERDIRNIPKSIKSILFQHQIHIYLVHSIPQLVHGMSYPLLLQFLASQFLKYLHRRAAFNPISTSP